MARVKLFENVPFARTGEQQYLAHEVGLSGFGRVTVYRPASEVRASARSFEGVPVTNEHPNHLVSVQDLERLQVGIITNVRFDEATERLICDVWLWDEQAIKDVASGKRELSAGYINELIKRDGKLTQTDIKGNHVALVESGRAGSAIRIGG